MLEAGEVGVLVTGLGPSEGLAWGRPTGVLGEEGGSRGTSSSGQLGDLPPHPEPSGIGGRPWECRWDAFRQLLLAAWPSSEGGGVQF